MMRAIGTIAFGAAIVACGAMRASAAPATTVDADFVTAAATSHRNEIELARLELTRGVSDEARSFAKRMLEDHPPLVADLEALASRARASRAPAAADRLVRARLERSHGAAFDQQYVLAQVTGHLVAVSVFETEIADGNDARLRAYAKSALPTIREHLAVAIAAAKHIGGDSPFKGPQ